jgi:adenosylhomocysteine nucleosidase
MTGKTRGHSPILVMAIAVAMSFAAAIGQAENQQLPGPYLVLYAFDAEGDRLAQQMTIVDSLQVLGRTVYTGQLAGKQIVLAESGIGMTNAAMSTQGLIDCFGPRAIIFTGIAGAIDTSVHIGDITVCRRWSAHDYGYHGAQGFQVSRMDVYVPAADSVIEILDFAVDASLFAAAEKLAGQALGLDSVGSRAPRLHAGGVGVSGNCFIDNRDKRLWLSEQFDALVTDMESAAVAQTALVNGIPFIVFRSASDLAGGSGSETAGPELDRFFKVAADNSSRVVMAFLAELK